MVTTLAIGDHPFFNNFNNFCCQQKKTLQISLILNYDTDEIQTLNNLYRKGALSFF